MLKSNKGYSLIEVGVGILILTIFFLVSIGLFNGCYTNYRRIKQRNVAVDRAVYYIEQMLQQDSHVLAGFLRQNYEESDLTHAYNPNPYFKNWVTNEIKGISSNTDVKKRYALYIGVSGDSYISPTSDEVDKFILDDIDFLSNEYIRYDAKNASQTQKEKGSYGFLTREGRMTDDEYVITISNEQIKADNNESQFINSNNGAFLVKQHISRIPVNSNRAFGDNVLVLKVEVFYSYDFTQRLTEENMQVITIDTIKIMK